jgi:hypothetical protein
MIQCTKEKNEDVILFRPVRILQIFSAIQGCYQTLKKQRMSENGTVACHFIADPWDIEAAAVHSLGCPAYDRQNPTPYCTTDCGRTCGNSNRRLYDGSSYNMVFDCIAGARPQDASALGDDVHAIN